MRLLSKIVLSLLILVLAAWGVISCVEARKEVRILCGLFDPGKSEEAVLRALETATFLQYRTVPDGRQRFVTLTSPYALWSQRCEVRLSDSKVVSRRFEDRIPVERIAAGFAVAGFGWLLAFQLLLVAGAPLGRYAWGGQHERLPRGLRIASLISAGFLGLGLLAVLVRTSTTPAWMHPAVAEVILWIFFLLMGFSFVGNVLSGSPKERRTGMPVAFVLFCTSLAVALSSWPAT